LGLLLLGVAGTATGRTVSEPVSPGDTIEVLDQKVTYRGVEVVEGEHDAVVAEVEIDGARRHPSLVAFENLRRLLPETSLVSTPLRDVQVVLVDATDGGAAVVRVGVHPLQQWVWWGGLVLVAGGVLTAAERLRARDRQAGGGPGQEEVVGGGDGDRPLEDLEVVGVGVREHQELGGRAAAE
jgi:cytochrome c biogenesis factor